MILWELSERLRLRETLTRLYRVRISGAENVPAGACILVANHESVIDPWFLSLATRRRVRFMAKAELWRYRPVRWAMEAYGTFPVERGSGDPGRGRAPASCSAKALSSGCSRAARRSRPATGSGTEARHGLRSRTARRSCRCGS